VRTYPHHLTTDLPQLPVPSLEESLERYRTASAAMYDAAGEADVNQAIADFALGSAPTLQHTLEEYAETMAASGSNWMAEQWLERYLRNREPLLLTSNSLFQFNLPTASTGVDRIVELLQRIGSIHILQAARETPPEFDDEGRRLSMDAWATFNGGIRTPEVEEDIWMRAGTGATYRSVGLLYLGRMWEVPLTGSEGKLLAAEQLRSSVEYVLSQTEPALQSFAGFAALGSGVLALQLPWEAEENRSLYTRLTNMLFTLTLDPQTEENLDTLKRWAFQPGFAWAYKPLSYLVGLDNQLIAASVEHSVLEAGTLATAVRRMQSVELDTLDAQYDEHATRPQELIWHGVHDDLNEYYERAMGMQVQRVTVHHPEQFPDDISADAQAQLILMIAQQLTYGHIRAHNQCCDMRHFRAGRTETIRPVTLQAVNFVNALVQGGATQAHLTAALAAHQDWIRAAKTGKAFDRHMFMLHHIGQELGGANADIFRQYAHARENFLATSTADSPDTILRAIVPPTIEDGFGVHYTQIPSGIEYVLTSTQNTPRAEEFHASIQSAAELFYTFVAAHTPDIIEE